MEKALLAFGGKAVSLGDGKFSVPMVVFGSPETPDLSPMRDFFTKSTDFDIPSFPAPCTARFDHGQNEFIGKKALAGGSLACVLKMDDAGLFMEGQLTLSDAYEAKIDALIQAGRIGGSSGTIYHLMERKSAPNGTHEITRWPIGQDMSFTVRPADSRTHPLIELKSLEDFRSAMKSISPDFEAVELEIADIAMKSLPLSDSKVWNGAAAEKRMKAWATDGKGVVNVKKLSAGYARKGDKISDLGFPFADVVDGKLQANPRGVIAAGTATMGARSGKEPDDADAIRKVLAPYYKEMKKTPPWEKDEKKALTMEEFAAKSEYFGECIEESMTMAALSRLNDQLFYGIIYAVVFDDSLSDGEKTAKIAAAFAEFVEYAGIIFSALLGIDGTPDDELKSLREIWSDPKEFSTQPIRSALKHVTEGLADTLERWDSEVFRFLSQGAKSTEVLKPKNQDALRSGYLQVEAACKYMKEIMDRAGVDYSESGTKNIDKAEEDKKSIELARMNLAMIEVKRDNERLLTT